MTKLAILNDIHLTPKSQEALQKLVGESVIFPDDMPTAETDLITRTNDAEAILVSPGTKITASYLDACPSVKYVGVCGTSMANIDVEKAKAGGVVVTNVVDYGDEPTAEFIFMQLLSLARGVGKYQWQDNPTELMGKSIGIIGLGALGKAIAHLALAFKMNVAYYSLHRKADWEAKGLRYEPLDTLVANSHIVVISSPSNVRVLGRKEFSLLSPNSILIQASMGDTFDRQAFLEWIANDNNFAIFDYAAGEDNYQVYKGLPRVIFPKIIAGHTIETRERLGERVVENLKNYLKGAL